MTNSPGTGRFRCGQFPGGSVALLLSMGAMVAVGVIAPRALAFLPALAGAVVFLQSCCKASSPERGPSKSLIPAFCLAPAILGLVSLAWADIPEEAMTRAGKVALTLLLGAFFLLAVSGLSSARIKAWSPLLPAIVGAGALLLGFDLFLGLPVLRLVSGVPEGMPFDPFHANRGVVVLSILFFPALAILKSSAGKNFSKRAGAAALCAAVCVMLWYGESQSAQMAFLLGVFILAVFPVNCNAAWKALAIGLCFCVFAAPWIAKTAFHALSSTLSGIREANIAPRLEIWDFVARRALENPVLGYGIEATRRMHFDTAEIYFKGNTVLHPHNFALQIWVEFGALGALCAAAFLYFMVLEIGRLPPFSARLSLATFIAALSVGATGYGLWQGWWLGALIVFAAWVLVARKIIEAEDDLRDSDSGPARDL